MSSNNAYGQIIMDTSGNPLGVSGNPLVTSSSGAAGTSEIYLGATAGTLAIQFKAGTLAVSLDPGHTLGKVDYGSGTFQVFFPDTGHEIGSIRGNTNTLTVFLPDTGHELGSVRGITNSINVYLGATAGTLGVRVGQVDGTVAVYFSQSAPAIKNIVHTIIIPNLSAGQLTGISVSGNTIAAPAAGVVRKVYAYNLNTTATLSNILAQITNGAGTSPTVYAQHALNSYQRMSVTPPGFLFAVPASTTLAIKISNAAGPTQYSIYWFNESA